MNDRSGPRAVDNSDVGGNSPEPLQGWTPTLSCANEIRAALEKAFDYRGDVTIRLRDGSKVEGYVFDRKADSAKLEECEVGIIPKESGERVRIPYSEVTAIEFTGRDPASGKSFQAWLATYRERKARGEKNISLEPELLE